MTTMDVWDAIPETGFFPEYLRYATALCDAPAIYHVGAMLASYATVVAGRAQLEFVVDSGATASFPLHLWILLLGKSSGRKSAAADRAVDLLEAYIGERGPTSGSPEGFYGWLRGRPSCLFYFTEMAALFSLQSASYWQQGQSFFLEVFDGRDISKSLSNPDKKKPGAEATVKFELIRPRVSLLGCATPSLLDNSTREVDWTGGLIGRMLPFYAERKEFYAWPNTQIPATAAKLRSDIAATLGALGQGETISITRSAMRAYEDWARSIDEGLSEYPDRLQALVGRLQHHILRVAGLYTISENYRDVPLEIMQRAINLSVLARKTIIRLGELLTPDKIARLVKQIRVRLLGTPNCTASFKDLMKSFNISYKTLEPAIRTLEASGEACVAFDTGSKRKWLKLIDLPKSGYTPPDDAPPDGLYN